MGMRVFLTGAGGYLGGVLARFLAADPEVECITGLIRRRPPTPLPPQIRLVTMDMRSPDLAAAMAGHDVVIHTAFTVLWYASMPAAERDDVNLNGVRAVAGAACANGVRLFLQASSVAAYDVDRIAGQTGVTEDSPVGTGRSFFYYANGKALAERSLAGILGPTGIRLTLLRPGNIIGPCNRSTVPGFRAAAGNIVGRDPRIQFVHEDDVAAAFMLALHRDMPGAYNVVPDDFIRYRQMWEILGVKRVPTLP
jgi:nucleoside-diphosphate-sugar epimerase